MTLAALMASDVDDVFLNTDEHAESCTFTPSSGSPRSITVVVIPQPSEIANEHDHEVEHKVILVLAKKHATEGIDTPAKGDSISWQGRAYSWVGWGGDDNDAPLLKFSCPSLKSHGPRQGFGL